MDDREARLLIGVGAQGTATLAVMQKLLRALITKEKIPDELGGSYSKSTGATIHQLLATFLDAPERGQKH